MGQLLNGIGELMTKDTEKAGILNTSFTSMVAGATSLQESQAPDTLGKPKGR